MLNKRDLLIITGVRPQYIKAKALVDAFARYSMSLPNIHVLNIAQHYTKDISTNIIEDLQLKVNCSLTHDHNVSPNTMISESLIGIEKYVKNKINNVPVFLVFGDANPALVGCIAGIKMGGDVIHVEAGSRRDKLEQEDLNSRMIDSVADLKLCVSYSAYYNLIKEGNADNTIITGDMAYEYYKNRQDFNVEDMVSSESVLVTLHRPQNMNQECVDNIVVAILKNDFKAIWITHPRIEKYIVKHRVNKYIDFLSPQSFTNIISLLKRCAFLITDSGGLSREAHYFKKYVLMRRDLGGWPELKSKGCMINIGKSYSDINKGIEWYKVKRDEYIDENVFYRKNGVSKGINAINSILNNNCDKYI